jgi:hypothetical protein
LEPSMKVQLIDRAPAPDGGRFVCDIVIPVTPL